MLLGKNLPLVINKGPVAALGVLEEELSAVVPDERVVARQHLAVEDGVARRGAGPGHGPAHLYGLVQGDQSVLEWYKRGEFHRGLVLGKCQSLLHVCTLSGELRG